MNAERKDHHRTSSTALKWIHSWSLLAESHHSRLSLFAEITELGDAESLLLGEKQGSVPRSLCCIFLNQLTHDLILCVFLLTDTVHHTYCRFTHTEQQTTIHTCTMLLEHLHFVQKAHHGFLVLPSVTYHFSTPLGGRASS